MKLLVVGGVTGGASIAARVRRLDEKAEIVIFEKGEHVSFSNCSLPYYLSGVVASSDDLLMMTPGMFRVRYNIDVRVKNEVVAIDRLNKSVTVLNHITGETYTESYDKLALSPGANPVMPKSIQGIDRKNVFSVRNVTDIVALEQFVDHDDVKDIVVVGGGFIGVEVAENLTKAGKKVRIVESLDQIMAPYDYDMVQTLHKELTDHGVELHLLSTLTAVEDGKVRVTKDGKEFSLPADAVVMAVGIAPETTLAKQAGLEIGASRGIKVNHNYQTSDPDIYAVGDAVEMYDRLAHTYGRIALAGPAQRSARAAADHICGRYHNHKGYIGSSCVKLFDLNAAATGLNEKTATKAGYSFDYVYVLANDKVSLMPDCHYMGLKLLFEVPTGLLLGAQAIGYGEVDKRVDVVAAMIGLGATLEDLKETELCYAPPFGTAKDVLNVAALVGLNVLYNEYPQVHVSDVRGLVESGAYILDVREPGEYAAGHLNGAHNLPLSKLRERMDEVPKDRPVYVHCRSSQRSYYALRCLQGNGYRNIVNISGSYLGISLFEYFNDVAQGRKPILDHYNFN